MLRFPFQPSAKPDDTKSTALADLIALQGAGQARWSGRDPASLAQSGYRRNVVAYRCIQMIADAAGSVPLTVSDASGRLCDDPICHLLANPNPEQTGQALLEAVFGHLQIYGDAFIEMIGDEDRTVALYPLRPDLVTIVTGPDGWPAAYEYRTGSTRRRISRLPNGRMPLIHLRLSNPVDDVHGQSPLAVAGNAIDLHNAALEWNKSLLDNAARPSGALIYRGPEGATNLTGNQFDRLKAELEETFQGQRHAGRPLVLDGGLDWKPMSLSPAEMDFLQLKNSAARDIALALGVPPMLLGIPGDNTYSNYQQAVLAFWRQTILPLISKVAAGLSVHLAGPGQRVGFDIDAIEALAESRTSRLDALLASDVVTSAEKRIALGLPPVPQEEGV